jgi:DNA-binding transcriptional MerR regulator
MDLCCIGVGSRYGQDRRRSRAANDERRPRADDDRRAGATRRDDGAHQSRGLLPPPQVRGRTGYYGDEHLARIELVRELQSEGLNLEAIRRLIEGAGDSSTELLDFTRALRAPFEEEQPEIVEATELAQIWGDGSPDPALGARAEKLGIIRNLPDGQVEVISPRLARAGRELAELGVGADVALATVEKMRRHSEGVARAFVDLFVKEIWEPFDRAGRPEEDWPKVREALERLRPLAADALLAVFQMAMSEATEGAAERTLKRKARQPKQKGVRRARRR